MLTAIHPKLPMRNKAITLAYYTAQLGFKVWGNSDTADYLMLEKDGLQVHFFLFTQLDPLSNYGQLYIRCKNIETLYRQLLQNKTAIHPNGQLQPKPWGQLEFSLLDPDHNLLTFGQAHTNF